MPSTNVLIGARLAGLVAVVIVLVLALSGTSAGGGNVSEADVTKVRTAMTAAGCTLESKPSAAEQQHMSSADQTVSYPTFPASSGT